MYNTFIYLSPNDPHNRLHACISMAREKVNLNGAWIIKHTYMYIKSNKLEKDQMCTCFLQTLSSANYFS